jgi:hypothetical protein
LINKEKDVIYEWLRNSAESKDAINISIEDLIVFYKEKISAMNDDDISIGGFFCF